MTHNPFTLRRRAVSGAAALITASVVFVGALVPISASAAPARPAPDGLSAATAAASCWEVKQTAPGAADGLYWLATPTMPAPQQFYCDQTTDGGGWVLIGRGREDWTTSDEGQGTVADVSRVTTGPGAFAPRQLSVTVIDGLTNGGKITDLSDGVRLRRAADQAGTSWQEARFTFSSPRERWTWQFSQGGRIANWTIGSTSGRGGSTESFGSNNALNRLQTSTNASHGWMSGFGYGSEARGVSGSSTYIWAPSTTAPNPRPFTQVFLRPKLVSSALFTEIPQSGTAAVQQQAIPSSSALTNAWGVTGLGAAGSGIQNTEVSAFAEINGVVYVGGNFRYVQRNASGLDRVEQSYLAAFDARTGEWISAFRPRFNHQVKSLAALPGGRLAVGGQFSTANGSAAAGLVVLDGASGATDTRFTGRLINYLGGGSAPLVRTLDVQGGFLYVGGSFTHATGGSVTSEVYSRSAVRLSVTDGTPDRSWTPEFNGTVISLDASERGDRVFFAGYFANNRRDSTPRAAALSSTDASTIPWSVDFSNLQDGRLGYQQAVKEVGDRVWLGGSEHMLFSYDRNSMQELSTNITNAGGDFQAISSVAGYVYAGCHCSQSNFEGARKWPSIGTAWTNQAKISQTGIWNSTTGRYVPDFSPSFTMREGAGTWALFTDSTGVTWMGGDFSHASRNNLSKMWTGSFARFPSRDSVAPTTPRGLTVTTSGSVDELRWSAASDDSGRVAYQILLHDRVVATTSNTSASLPAAPAGMRYFVRAADDAGNRSASTAGVIASGGPPPSATRELIASGSTWRYYFAEVAPTAGWQNLIFDDSAWASGPAPLGFGHSSLGTTLTTAGTKPLASYYRRSVEIADASQVASVTFTTRADDGVVVYVNGTEVHRANMPQGQVTHGTFASSAVSAAAAVSSPVTFTVPGNLFRTGANAVTAEVHSNYRSTPSVSFELSATVTAGAQPAPPPTPAPASAAVIPAGSTWSYHFGGAPVDAAWTSTAFQGADWRSGRAPLGYGDPAVVTTLATTEQSVPLAAYFRTAFHLDAVPAAGLRLTTRADDGVVVFVNGTEVGRSNLPAGTVTADTYAIAARRTETAVATPVIIEVPASLLTTGRNVIAAQVQSNYRATPDKSFELEAVKA